MNDYGACVYQDCTEITTGKLNGKAVCSIHLYTGLNTLTDKWLKSKGYKIQKRRSKEHAEKLEKVKEQTA